MLEVISTSKKLVGLALVCSFMLSACGRSPIRNPFENRAEPELSKISDVEGVEQAQAEIVWSKLSHRKSRHTYSKLNPIAFGQKIYSVEDDGTLIAMNISDGRQLWHIKSKLHFTAGPEVIDGNLILAASSMILAFDLNTGEEKWRRKVASEVLSSPKGNAGILVVQAVDGTVVAMSSSNGEILWEVPQTTPALSLRTKSAPAISGDKVLVGLSNGKIVILNLYSGMEEWTHTLAVSRGRSELQRLVDISADPIMIGDIAYVVAYQGNLAALDVHKHELLWERKISAFQDMAFDQKSIYITDDEHNLWAIDQKTGATLWKQSQLVKRYITSPSVQGRYVVVADRGGYVHWIHRDTGHIKGRVEMGKKFYQQPIVSNQYVLLREHNGKLSMLDAK